MQQNNFDRETANLTLDLIVDEINDTDWTVIENKEERLSEIVAKYTNIPNDTVGNHKIVDNLINVYKNILYPEKIEQRLLKEQNYQRLNLIKKTYPQGLNKIYVQDAIEFFLSMYNSNDLDNSTDMKNSVSFLVNSLGFKNNLPVVGKDGNLYTKLNLLEYILQGFEVRNSYKKEYHELTVGNILLWILNNKFFANTKLVNYTINQLNQTNDTIDQLNILGSLSDKLINEFYAYFIDLELDYDKVNIGEVFLKLLVAKLAEYNFIDLRRDFIKYFGL
jgi:hypothetical protein